MDLDALLRPVSPDMPCGQDLNATLDPEYEDYYFGALGRLPDYYTQPGVARSDGSLSPDKVFDPKSVDTATETRLIDALLGRSRDLRLLVLRAQWDILAGRLGPMVDAVDAMAGLLETYPDAVHPTTGAGPGDRRDAIADLNQQNTIVQPLLFTGLTGTTEVTLRKIRVAGGSGARLQDEHDLIPGPLTEALGMAANRKRVDDTHSALIRLVQALNRIDHACQSHASAPFTPALDKVRGTVTDMIDAITNARPDLRGTDVASLTATATAPTPRPGRDGLQRPPVALAPVQAAPGPAPDVVSHLHARRILESCERYFRRAEPSSAALLLVTQARLLIGRPLIEALQTLLPQKSGQAVVDFGPATGFALDAERLALLSAAIPETADTDTPNDPDPGPDIRIRDGADVAAALRAVEDYFRRTERSSPVPVLLQRGRSYLDRDFQSLVDELIPQAEDGQTR